MADNVFPEDEGTGVTSPDFNDAAQFASMARLKNAVDYVQTGLEIQNVDYNNLVFDISEGVAKVTKGSAQTVDHGNGKRTIRNVAFTIQADRRSDLALTSGSVNHIYIRADLTNQNAVKIIKNTTGGTPAQPYLKLAEIDEPNQTVTLFNRNPTAQFDEISGRAAYSINPVTVPTAELPNGDFIGTRDYVPDGKVMKVWEAGVINDSQAAPTGLKAVVRNITDGQDAVNLNTKKDIANSGQPLATITGPKDIQYRTQNDTGGVQNASSHFGVTIEEETSP